MKFLETNSTSPYYNLAFEEYVLRNYLEDTYLILWQNDNTIVVGRHQNTEAEINRQFVDDKKINVVRRMTGGGAVYHDMGNLNFSLIMDVTDRASRSMDMFTRPIVKALEKMGLRAELSGRNDILAEGKKISGNAQRIHKNRILHHGTLLFDADLKMVSSALNVDPRKFQSKGVKSVASRVGNIKEMLSSPMTVDEFKKHILDTFHEEGVQSITPTEEELKAINTLCESKYKTWEWNYGASPAYDKKSSDRFEGGGMEILTSVKNGTIDSMRIFGDFLAKKPVEQITDQLKGLPFRRENVETVLNGQDMEAYFGGITANEFLGLLFE